MKLLKFSILGLAFLSAACSSDDDDAKPSLNKRKVSFLEKSEVISVPAKMQQSDNEYAQMAASWITMANSMNLASAFSEVPEGIPQQKTRIVASNGRAAASEDFATYVWTDEASGYSVGYQISEHSNSYQFEIFFILPGETEWVKFMDAQETKDLSAGHLIIYDAFGEYGDDAAVEALSYEWLRSGDNFSMSLSQYQSEFALEFTVNTKTGAGEVEYIVSGEVLYYIEWDANGAGSYVIYNEFGEVEDEGTWS